MFGILNVNKPAGWTSRDVVNRIQRIVRPAKAGHAGTLDPLATGVLVVCVGPATRLISNVQQQAKCYEATFLLGRSSPSDDIETEVTELDSAPQPSRADIEAELPSFLGSIEQRPPAFSAIKVKGQRAYALARRGEQVDLAARTIEIYDLALVSYAYPELKLSMRCGSGTYVRSLGRDLAEVLGTNAVMSALTRTAIGEFVVADSVDIERLDEAAIQKHLSSPLLAVPQLPRLELDQQQAGEIQHGRLISANDFQVTAGCEDGVFAATNLAGELIALLSFKRPGMLGPTCNFSQPA